MMPIPILKGLRRAGSGPQNESQKISPRNEGASARIPSPRSNIRAPSASSSASSSPSSTRETRAPRPNAVIKNSRNQSCVRNTLQSPRPPPRISSTIASPKALVKQKVSKQPEIKIAQVPRTTPVYDVPHIAIGLPNSSANNSNRSSLISNGSSIPPPSSSSSNRNSNSSISSNFSVGSWNSNGNPNQVESCQDSKEFLSGGGGGSDTFPRSSGFKRSLNPVPSLSTSLNVDTRQQQPRMFSQQKMRLKEPNKCPQKIKNLSYSESAIAKAKSSEELSNNNSDTNLSFIKNSRQNASLRFPSNKSISKSPIPNRGATKTTSNYYGHSYLSTTNRSADPNANKATRQTNIESPRSCSGNKYQRAKVRSAQMKTPELHISSSNQPSKSVMKSTKRQSNSDTTSEEDDGYSSVAQTDQPDDDEKKNAGPLMEDNDYDEVEANEEVCDLEDIEPMKPLGGIYRYRAQGLQNKFIDSTCDSTKESNSHEKSAVPHPSNNLKPHFEGELERASKILLSPGGNPLSSKANQDSSFQNFPSRRSSEVPVVSRMHSSEVLSPKIKMKNLRSSLPKTGILQHNRPNSDSSMSAIDDSVLDISYKNFVKSSSPTKKEGYSWESRNSFGGTVPEESSSKRKQGIGLLCQESVPTKNIASPSLPALACNPLDNCSITTTLPPRPNSLMSPIKLQFKGVPVNSSFIRTGSLRSPSINNSSDRKITYPFPGSQESSKPSSMTPFVRNSPKYSTVIPRTKKDDLAPSYPFLHSLDDFANEEDSLSNPVNSSSKKLENELKNANEKIETLVTQLTASNKLVAAYEHSLSNMTQRLQQLSKVSEQKDNEIFELRKLMERSCWDSSSGTDSRSSTLKSVMHRSSSIESMTSLSSTASFSSAISSSTATSYSSADRQGREKAIKKKNWLRSSFSKAFRRREKRKRSDIFPSNGSPSSLLGSDVIMSDSEIVRGYCSLPSSPLPQRPSSTKLDETTSDFEFSDNPELRIQSLMEEVARLRKTLRNKEATLTETRLESLSSAHQIDALKGSIHKLSNEVAMLRSENEDFSLQRESNTFDCFSDDGSSFDCSSSSCDTANVPTTLSTPSISSTCSNFQTQGKSVRVLVFRSDYDKNFSHCVNDHLLLPQREYLGDIVISEKTAWEDLDKLIADIFEENLKFLDPKSKLSLDGDSILNYHLGEIKRTPMLDNPEFLPCGYLVGEVDCINVNLNLSSLNSVDAMAFETLVSKNHLLRYISFLKDQRRIILTGPKGVGKSFLAHRLADFVVQRLGIAPSIGNIAIFNVNEKTPQDLHSYLAQINDLCESKSTDLPMVIILECLENIEKLSEVLSASLQVSSDQCPFIIGTMRIEINGANSLKVHPSFRLIPLDPTTDPVANIFPRICRRYLKNYQTTDLEKLFEWLCRCLRLLNEVLDSTSIETFGPGTFLPLPSSLNIAQVWFTELWKSHIVPSLQKAAKNITEVPQDLQLWKDFDKCLKEELPWGTCATNVSLPNFS